jgi:hypothetical protein
LTGTTRDEDLRRLRVEVRRSPVSSEFLEGKLFSMPGGVRAIRPGHEVKE